MIKYFYIFILVGVLTSGCSNQYTGLGFPYSNQDKQAKIESIEIPEEGQDVIKATEEILSASVEKIPTITAIGYAVVSTQPGKNVAQKSEIESGTSAFQHFEVFKKVQLFLTSLIDHGVVLESHQKQRFLQLLEQCSSSFTEQSRETNSQSPVVFKKDRDGHKFSSQIYGIERIVGLKSIQQFLAKKYNLLASENLLLKSLSQRVDLCVRKEGFEPENEAMQELSILRDFRYNRDAFFGSPLIVENFTYLHQYSPGDFNDACIQLAHLNSKRRVRIIDDLVDKVVHSSYSVDQMNMMHDMLFTMHQDYNHSQFLKDFIKEKFLNKFQNLLR